MMTSLKYINNIIRRASSRVGALWLTALTLLPQASYAEDPDKEYLEYCVANIIEEKYVDTESSGVSLCWACDIVHTLMKYMTEAIQLVYDATKDLAVYILIGGASIWIAVYLLKALGSFATQDPAKIIDGLLTFCFKIAILYFLIAHGIDTMTEYIVNPLLTIGFDIGTEYSNLSGLGN